VIDLWRGTAVISDHFEGEEATRAPEVLPPHAYLGTCLLVRIAQICERFNLLEDLDGDNRGQPSRSRSVKLWWWVHKFMFPLVRQTRPCNKLWRAHSPQDVEKTNMLKSIYSSWNIFRDLQDIPFQKHFLQNVDYIFANSKMWKSMEFCYGLATSIQNLVNMFPIIAWCFFHWVSHPRWSPPYATRALHSCSLLPL